MITGFTLDGDEYIWTRRPNFSECNRPRFGVPVLFPSCGNPDGGVHNFDGKAYPMETHGFADLCAWDVESVGPDGVTLALESTPLTKFLYPFDFTLLGPDTGFDMINTATCGGQIAALLSALNDTDECPKTIIYSLNPGDDAQIGTILGCFQNSEIPGKIQHGSAWWFNDHKIGMEEQMSRLASLGLLGNFVGMLTDSRSFLSYTRHDYFRRILCNLIGQWVEDGEYPNDEKALEKIVKGICFDKMCIRDRGTVRPVDYHI